MKRLVVALLCVGCGDALVVADYQGEPLLSVSGRIADFRHANADEVLRASVFWWQDDQPQPDVLQLVEHEGVATKVTFPATFEVNVFTPPPLERLDATRPFQIGTVLVYADEDQDEHLSEGELRGGAMMFAIVFAADPIPVERSPSGERLPAGYSLVRLPLPCGLELKVETSGETCGVPLGAACTDDQDCGTGWCVQEDDYVTYPGGMCVLDWTPGGCQPNSAVVDVLYFEDERVERDVYLPMCGAQSDCREGYECLLAVGACVPEEPFFLDLFPAFEPMPFCLADFEGW